MATDNSFAGNPLADARATVIVGGVKSSADRLGLKTEQSLAGAAKFDPLAAQVGSNLAQKLLDGQATSLSELQACEADKACTAGMVEGVLQDKVGKTVGRLVKIRPLTP